ncbi:ABC transporter permease [Methanotrichaceae archaeon M04Ac]|uniref:ABC transporter permease n=1 Tax=Candidatus Methanocrinis alkalitolerans TaxID=3033395 RepID=A0ABT5XDE4_9EURY|nr:ABC transporter permease [Candidatus Methanocrinis alkalitolerans]MCR3884877.1 ABC transporter permease [Methanothrix sp.]MDF0592717.1 ABC transporter permease [Candidatus Methanocrinis alkalitolerans]
MALIDKAREELADHAVEALSVAGLVVVWQLLALAVANPLKLPSFLEVAEALLRQWETILWVDLPVSLIHFAIGMTAGLLLALPIGMAMGWSRIADRIFDPIVELIRPIPPLAWIPFAIIWFGLTPQAAGFIVFVGAVFPILINSYVGFRSVPRVYVESAMVLGATRNRDLLRYVAFPSALPSIAAGIRIAMGIAWMCIVAAEMFGASTRSGLGYRLWEYYSLHMMEMVFLYMIVLGLLGLFIDRTFRYVVQEKLLRWQEGIRQN